jgi:hypothetical protein
MLGILDDGASNVAGNICNHVSWRSESSSAKMAAINTKYVLSTQAQSQFRIDIYRVLSVLKNRNVCIWRNK